MIDFYLEKIISVVWSLPVLCFFLFVHVYFTFKTKAIQKHLLSGIILSLRSSGKEKISPFEALSVMLASALGTGNIIGMGTMIALGGPGAVFWCFISGLFAMATKYAETYICVKHRVPGKDGYVGGAMYILKNVLNKKRLAFCFALFTFLASFGIGASVQSNAVYEVCKEAFGSSALCVSVVLCTLAIPVIFGGACSVGKACSFAVPVMSVLYTFFCILILFRNLSYIPAAIKLIIYDAFDFRGALCGICASTMLSSVRLGISRGLFTNEAGLGSSPIAACESEDNAENASLGAMSTVFWDTIFMCSITALCMVTHIIKNAVSLSDIQSGIYLAFMCFDAIPFGKEFIAICVCLFGFASVLGWSFFGQRGFEYIFGSNKNNIFRFLWILAVFISPFLSANTLWLCADILNAFMMTPNLYMLIKMRKQI